MLRTLRSLWSWVGDRLGVRGDATPNPLEPTNEPTTTDAPPNSSALVPTKEPERTSTIQRFSSRSTDLSEFLTSRLRDARLYRRIAGYFRSSILSVVGSDYGGVQRVELVCNSSLSAADLRAIGSDGGALLGAWRKDAGTWSRWHHAEFARLVREGRLRIRVLPRETIFVHGKAGVITFADGSRSAFLGSVNESESAFVSNHELLWEDSSREAVEWVDGEFLALWDHPDAVDLPDVIVWEAEREANAVVVGLGGLVGDGWLLARAFVLGCPLVLGGGFLRVWQREFVRLFLRHRGLFGRVRLLLGDEVGLGKTLSLGVCGVLGVLLDGGRGLFVVPASLVRQWQGELWGLLGVEAVVLEGGFWVFPSGVRVRVGCLGDAPGRLVIVSQGFVVSRGVGSREWGELLGGGFSVVVVDEAHRLRVGGGGNVLREFVLRVAGGARHVLLGSGTPIQLVERELWDLVGVLGVGADFVLGDEGSVWRRLGREGGFGRGFGVGSVGELWDLLRNPLPVGVEWGLGGLGGVNVFEEVRADLGLGDGVSVVGCSVDELVHSRNDVLGLVGREGFFERVSPLVRHVVLRRRSVLEERGLLRRVSVRLLGGVELREGLGLGFSDEGFLVAPSEYVVAYEVLSGLFDELVLSRGGEWGLLRPLLQQRLCSSLNAAFCTVRSLLGGSFGVGDVADGDVGGLLLGEGDLVGLVGDGVVRERLAFVESCLVAALGVGDPKYVAVLGLLRGFVSDGVSWLSLGVVVFSQYRDTAEWFFERLGVDLGGVLVGLYCGGGVVRLVEGGVVRGSSRGEVGRLVSEGRLRVLVATDAASEGLNLQALGCVVNVDLPWNPARLEQRVGRVRRFGQVRERVDVVNLVYAGTRDLDVVERLSSRLEGVFGVFRRVPDVIVVPWVDEFLAGEVLARERVHLRDVSVFAERYEGSLVGGDEDLREWLDCGVVLREGEVREWLLRV